MAYARAMSSAALAALCCLAVFAVVNYTGDSTSIKLSEDPDAEAPEVDLLANLVDLKSYCLAAYDNSNIIAQNHPKVQAIVDFVHTYGINGGGDDVGGRKAEVDNIVTEYAQIMGAMKAKYGHGVNSYILDAFDHSIRNTPGGPTETKLDWEALGGGGSKGHKFGHMAYLKYQELGLEDQPNILVELAAKYAKFLTFKAHIEEHAKNADVIAATVFLQQKGYGHYQSFFQQVVAKVEKRMRSEFNFVAKAAFDAEEDAFQKSYEENREAFFEHVAKQAPAAVTASSAAASEFPWVPPTIEEMKQMAHNKSVAFMHEFQENHADPSALLKRITSESGGIKIFITTTGATDAQSTMKPELTVTGKLSTFTHAIRAVPGQGKTFTQHFAVDTPVGEIQSIKLTGTGEGLKWNCAGIKLRSGGVGEHIRVFTDDSPADSFWLESGQEIELFPREDDDDEPDLAKDACRGWVGTAECKGDGTVDADEAHHCTEEIDSSMSGYCDCSSGHRATMDCGHDSFTCEEICGV